MALNSFVVFFVFFFFPLFCCDSRTHLVGTFSLWELIFQCCSSLQQASLMHSPCPMEGRIQAGKPCAAGQPLLPAPAVSFPPHVSLLCPARCWRQAHLQSTSAEHSWSCPSPGLAAELLVQALVSLLPLHGCALGAAAAAGPGEHPHITAPGHAGWQVLSKALAVSQGCYSYCA